MRQTKFPPSELTVRFANTVQSHQNLSSNRSFRKSMPRVSRHYRPILCSECELCLSCLLHQLPRTIIYSVNSKIGQQGESISHNSSIAVVLKSSFLTTNALMKSTKTHLSTLISKFQSLSHNKVTIRIV